MTGTSTPLMGARAARDTTDSARRRSLLICSTAVFVVMLDSTIVNVALPRIGRAFSAGTSGLQWVVDGYLLVLACGLLSAGAAGDRFGRRRVFRIGLTVFGLASAAASVAPGMAALIGCRMVQGLGAAMLPPSTLSIIANTFPDRQQRLRAMGTWGALSGLAVAAGPLLGGVLVSLVGWRSIFWINVPITAAAIVLTARYVEESRAPRPRSIDPVGQILAVLGLAATTDALIEAPRRGWTSSATVVLFIAATVALLGFVLVERRRSEPMLDMGYFRDRAFSGAAAVAVLAYFAINGFTFLSTLYLQNLRGENALIAGLSLLPATALVLPLAPLSARLTAKHGPRRPVIFSTGAMLVGLLVLSRIHAHQSYTLLAVGYAAMGVGMGMVNPPLTTTAVSALPPEQSGVAAGVTGTSRQVGAVFGVALLGSLLTSGGQASRYAFIQASHRGFVLAAGAAGIAAVIGWFTLTDQRRHARRPIAPRKGG